jgi:hypothetical protein
MEYFAFDQIEYLLRSVKTTWTIYMSKKVSKIFSLQLSFRLQMNTEEIFKTFLSL